MRRRIRIPGALLIIVCAVSILSIPALADFRPKGATEPAAARRSKAPPDVHTPSGALRSFFQACRRGDYAVAAERLNLGGLADEERAEAGPRLARQLESVLRRGLSLQDELVTDRPEGDTDDGLPEHLERLGAIQGTEVLLERIETETGAMVWRFTESTVNRIPELYADLGYGIFAEYLPEPLLELEGLGLRLWQWLALLVLVLASWIVSWFVAWLLRLALHPFAARTDTILDDEILQDLVPPVRLLVAAGLFGLGTLVLALPLAAYDFLGGVEMALVIVATTWAALRGVDIVAREFRRRLEATERGAAAAAIPLGSKTAKVILVALGTVVLLQNLGFNVTGLLAGLGVGGLAVALAAQKTIANLFGGVSLITDQPIRVGDFCRFGADKVGTVEEIGLRSTRVRTLDRTLVSIPNAEFSEMQLENFGARDRMRFFTVIGLRYETTPDQLRHVLVEFRKLLAAHPRIAAEPARARFVGFGAHSLDIEVFAYAETSDWNEFLKIREDVLLRLIDVVEESGTGFAFPSQTLYLGRDQGLDEERARQAEKRVRAWREAKELPFPDFSPEAIAAIDGTLDYPPKGSFALATAGPASPAGGEEPR